MNKKDEFFITKQGFSMYKQAESRECFNYKNEVGLKVLE